MGNPAVFFDRDGTLIEQVHYLGDPADVRVLPGIPSALQLLRSAGYLIVVITNQAAIGKGIISEADYSAVQNEMLSQLGGVRIDATYYCPDSSDRPSLRRKPAPTMVFEAARDLGIDLANSYFVGDNRIDIECGQRAGVRTVLVLTGYGSQQQGECEPDFKAQNAAEAVQWILSQQIDMSQSHRTT